MAQNTLALQTMQTVLNKRRQATDDTAFQHDTEYSSITDDANSF